MFFVLQAHVVLHTMSVVQPQPLFSLDVQVSAVPHPEAHRDDCPSFHCWLRRLQICTR